MLFDLDGFRLQRGEFYNWGTFHRRVWRIEPGEHNSLLTGDIGSGKSTIVDALTILLVPRPSNQIVFNKAAGAEAKERTLRSYVLGEYKNDIDDDSKRAKAVVLRDHNSYSVLLAVFHNASTGQDVCLAQVFYFRDKTGQPDRLFVVAEADLSISQHFKDFDDMNQLRLRLRRMGATVCDGLKDYSAKFRSLLGIASDRALDLFYQTLSMKSVADLTHFVRDHMLDAEDTHERVETLCRSFDDLDRAHQAVVKARHQISLLEPLITKGDELRGVEQEANQLRTARDNLGLWKASQTVELEQQHERQLAIDLEKHELKLRQIAADASQLDATRDGLTQAVATNGGARLQELARDRLRLEQEHLERFAARQLFDKRLAGLDLPKPDDASAFTDLRRLLTDKDGESNEQEAQTANREKELDYSWRQLRQNIDQLQEEIHEIEGKPSNIPAHLLRLRATLCKDLNLGPEHLPFAGELIQVSHNATEWEGAIERVLHNFALSLLVSDAQYTAVTDWVDRTNLKGRLVYYRLTRSKRVVDLKALSPESLVHKIVLKEDSSAYDWVLAQLSDRFDYRCCQTLEDFRRSTQALTMHGQIRGAGERHEKDDRHSVQDRARFVLGWDNQAKLKALRRNLGELQERGQHLGADLAAVGSQLRALREQSKALALLLDVTNFDALDHETTLRHLVRIKAEQELIEQQSSQLKKLQAELAKCLENIQTLRTASNDRQEKVATCKANIRLSRERREESEAMLIEAARDDLEEAFRPLRLVYDQLFADSPNLQNVAARERQLREKLQAEIDSLDKRASRLVEFVIGAMKSYILSYPAETVEVDASLNSLVDFERILSALLIDDLPKYEERFKRELNEKTIQAVVHFQSRLERSRRDILERLAQINSSLRRIDYNDGSFIELRGQPTPAVDVRQFQSDLRACLEGTLSDSLYDEARFLSVKGIIERLRGRQGSVEQDLRWAERVTDVRNWFEFAAAELWRADGTIKEYYESGSGKSGGQKEKLAYTILASALAYQYGIDRANPKVRSFRFVCIDEAFGRGSDESTRYGLELFSKLGLQLLIVTPLQKIRVIEDYVRAVHFVHNDGGKNSMVRNLTIEDYRRERQLREVSAATNLSLQLTSEGVQIDASP